MTKRLAGRRALVTGASRGIGAGVAERLAAEGADVVLVARTAEPGGGSLGGSLAETAERVASYGTRVAPYVADLADEQSRAGIVPAAAELLGGAVDILVNNAAAAIYQPLGDFPLRRRRLTFEVNVHAPLDLAQAVLPGMRAAGEGWIVNISSASARHFAGPPFELVEPGADLAVYAASKAALNRITNGLGAELYGTGIRVNTVQPRAAVLSEGASLLVGDTIRPDQVESLEEMVEAVLALCDCPADVTGRTTVSLDLIRDWGLTVHPLEGASA
jgi:NAD(P)-dependent dehydrogenase (short-subunit alcohol dehydrogenase family)